MNSRSIALILLATPVLVVSIASASETSTCPAGQGGEGALTTIGGRSFAPDAGGLRETRVTSYCIGCHDGTVSRPVVVESSGFARTAASPFGSTTDAFDHRGTHPVDISYPDGRRGFRPALEVERSLPLSGGLVTCETCHAADSSTPFRLTISNEGSRLCLTCHEK